MSGCQYPVDPVGGSIEMLYPTWRGIPEGGLVMDGGGAGQVVEIMFATEHFPEE